MQPHLPTLLPFLFDSLNHEKVCNLAYLTPVGSLTETYFFTATGAIHCLLDIGPIFRVDHT